MVKIKCHQYNAAIKIAANVNTFFYTYCVSEKRHSAMLSLNGQTPEEGGEAKL